MKEAKSSLCLSLHSSEWMDPEHKRKLLCGDLREHSGVSTSLPPLFSSPTLKGWPTTRQGGTWAPSACSSVRSWGAFS